MKELLRLTYSLTRPSKVGIFNKDKILIPILHAIAFFALYCLVFAILTFNTTYLGNETASEVTELMQICKFANVIELNEDQITFDSSTSSFQTTLKGYKDFSYKDAGVYIYFFMGENQHSIPNDSVILDFKEKEVDVYYNTIFSNKPVTYKYANSITENFDLYDVLSGQREATIVFNQILTDAFENANIRYQVYHFLSEIGKTLVFYGILIFFLLLFSTASNPTIEMKVRMKLVLYDSLPYLFIMMLMYMFNFSYLQYLALLLPFIYSIITFRHILRVKK